MKQLISEEFIDFKLLTPKQKEEVEHMREVREESFHNLLSVRQNELLEREDELMERMAKAAGFDGYETGECNYKDVYHMIMKDSFAIYGELREKYHKFELSKWEGPFSEEYKNLHEDVKALKNYETEQKVWLKQQYLNDALTVIRPKAEKYKLDNGVRFPSASEYNKLSQEQKDALRQPYSQEVQDKEGNDILIDESIAGKLKRIWGMGIVTGASCSGMVQDHPYHRHDEDNRFGRWKKGVHSFIKAQTPHAYITFPVEDNHPEMIEKTQQMADKWGWVVDRQDIYGKDSIVLRPAHTLDGTSYTQIQKEIEYEIEGIMAQYGLSDVDEARDDARKSVELNHGGQVMYTDRMLAYNWRQLTEGLGDIMYQIQRDTLKKNIEEGKAVEIYRYDARFATLNADQLVDIFQRSGIILDKKSIPAEGLKGIQDKIWNMPRILVEGKTARLMGKDEPDPDKTLLMSTHNLSRLLAEQIKGTVHTSEPEPYDYKMTVMIHPNPQTAKQVEKFTLTCNIDSVEYFRLGSENYDMTYLLASKFGDALYRAAIDAYENSIQGKKVEENQLQTVSDIRIRKGLDGNTYISCHINGEKQLAKRMKPGDAEYYRMRMSQSDKAYNGVAPELVKKYFAREIEESGQQREQQHSMKR